MTSSSPIKVLLVDDQPTLLWGLEMLIQAEWPRMAVVGKATDRAAALRLAAEAQPDVILLDLNLNGDLSLDFLPELCRLSPAARVLIFTGLRDPLLHERALRNGAVGIVLKDEPAGALLDAIVNAHRSRAPRTELAAP